MKLPKMYIWLVLVFIFILNQILERAFQIRIPLLYSYLDDLLVIPIVLGMYQLLMQQFNKKFTTPWYMVLLAITMLSVHFEIIMPQISQKYTSDIFDVLMYIMGGTLYMAFLYKLPKKKKATIPFAKSL